MTIENKIMAEAIAYLEQGIDKLQTLSAMMHISATSDEQVAAVEVLEYDIIGLERIVAALPTSLPEQSQEGPGGEVVPLRSPKGRRGKS